MPSAFHQEASDLLARLHDRMAFLRIRQLPASFATCKIRARDQSFAPPDIDTSQERGYRSSFGQSQHAPTNHSHPPRSCALHCAVLMQVVYPPCRPTKASLVDPTLTPPSMQMAIGTPAALSSVLSLQKPPACMVMQSPASLFGRSGSFFRCFAADLEISKRRLVGSSGLAGPPTRAYVAACGKTHAQKGSWVITRQSPIVMVRYSLDESVWTGLR